MLNTIPSNPTHARLKLKKLSLLLASRFSLLASRFSLLASRFSLLASRFSLLASQNIINKKATHDSAAFLV